jgi:hypothetical protein
MGIASIARTEQVEVATTCRKFATSDLGIGNCDEIKMCLLSGRTHGFSEPEQLTQRKSKRLIEGFVCNPLFVHVSISQCQS